MSYWVAVTACEGPWWFTRAGTREAAIENFANAVRSRSVLSIPIDNPVSAAEYPTLRVEAELKRQAEKLAALAGAAR